jgi:hypothetical protein
MGGFAAAHVTAPGVGPTLYLHTSFLFLAACIAAPPPSCLACAASPIAIAKIVRAKRAAIACIPSQYDVSNPTRGRVCRIAFAYAQTYSERADLVLSEILCHQSTIPAARQMAIQPIGQTERQ